MLNKDEVKLLSCPFCGGIGRLYINKESRFGDKYAVICLLCSSRTPDLLTPEEAVELWNTRNTLNAAAGIAQDAERSAENENN